MKVRFALILGGLSAFAPLSVDMYLPAFPVMTGQLGATQSEIQLTLTTFVVSLALGQAIAGPLSDAFGRRPPLIAGLVLYAVTSVACAFAPSAAVLVVLRFLQGLGAAAGIVISRAQVRDLYSGIAMARFFSSLMLVNGLAPIIAPVIGGQIMRFTSWRGVFVVLAVIGTVLLLATLLGLPETLPSARRRPARIGGVLRSYGRLLGNRVFLGYALTSAVLFAALFGYISGSSFVLQDVYGLSPQQFSLVFGVNSVGIMIAGQVSSLLLRWCSPRALVASGLAIAVTGGAGSIVAVVAGLGLAGLLPPMFLLISSVGLVMPNATALGLADQANTAGAASALIGLTQFLIGGLTAPLAGSGGSSALPMVVLMGSAAVLAAACYFGLTSGHQGHRQDSDDDAGHQGGDQLAARPGQEVPDHAATAGQQQLPAR
ncbi:DHA1 family bicyclomycin/chloramphenicol resistance-like MFS transporter [Actinocrispum wychmicini]|uniref:DHA1 family bicyclomycin/chloramphenicol resistance-like MFS transporter n=1 Tax=Actinocrispum wychmicini TaxID=1213861 RepID=A0A4R2INC4_9PSEU|nr:DHA1 family bicyclomycin/chloramphenicol resistance-like MFS transporter [Actinocrispum wychmicini]